MTIAANTISTSGLNALTAGFSSDAVLDKDISSLFSSLLALNNQFSAQSQGNAQDQVLKNTSSSGQNIPSRPDANQSSGDNTVNSQTSNDQTQGHDVQAIKSLTNAVQRVVDHLRQHSTSASDTKTTDKNANNKTSQNSSTQGTVNTDSSSSSQNTQSASQSNTVSDIKNPSSQDASGNVSVASSTVTQNQTDSVAQALQNMLAALQALATVVQSVQATAQADAQAGTNVQADATTSSGQNAGTAGGSNPLELLGQLLTDVQKNLPNIDKANPSSDQTTASGQTNPSVAPNALTPDLTILSSDTQTSLPQQIAAQIDKILKSLPEAAQKAANASVDKSSSQSGGDLTKLVDLSLTSSAPTLLSPQSTQPTVQDPKSVSVQLTKDDTQALSLSVQGIQNDPSALLTVAVTASLNGQPHDFSGNTPRDQTPAFLNDQTTGTTALDSQNNTTSSSLLANEIGKGPQNSVATDFASQLGAARDRYATAQTSPTDQVILNLHKAAANGDDQISVQLRPADLGTITVKLAFDGKGGVSGQVVADTQSTLDMLQKDSASLTRALQEAGLQADSGSLQFSLGGQQGQGNAQNGGQGQSAFGQPFAGGQLAASGETIIDNSAGAVWLALTPSRLNISV